MDIATKEIKRSAFNYRTITDAARLAELTASIKSKGVLQPILVRPLNGKKGKSKYEIVAGHRRFQSAIAAGLKEIPCVVRELTDEESLEVQVIENSQREDPNPMDEAAGFKRLLDMGKHTPDTLAEKLARSVDYVLGRLKLNDLDKAVQAKVASGELGLGHAILFTRLRQATDQKELLKEVLDEDMSAGQTKQAISGYLYRLSDAVFDMAKCKLCPSRSCNQATLFPELKKTDECADRSCFGLKTKEHWTEWLKEKKAAGFKTYTDEKTVDKLIFNVKVSTAISTIKKAASYSWPYPPKYMTECSACKDSHAYYVVETRHYDGTKKFNAGEICLNKECLNAQLRVGKKEKAESVESLSSRNTRDERMANMRQNEAMKCRDRFLHREMAARVPSSEEAQKRLIIWRFFDRSEDELPNPLSTAFPAERLDEEIKTVSINLMDNIDGDELLNLAPIVGLDAQAEFMLDREYLESFHLKADILKLAGELGIEADAKLAKEKLIEAILAQDLKGKAPAEIAGMLKSEEDAN